MILRGELRKNLSDMSFSQFCKSSFAPFKKKKKKCLGVTFNTLVTFNNGISAKLGSEEGREREHKNCLGSLLSLMEPQREHLSFCLICFSVISSVASGLWCVCLALAQPFH